MIKGRWLVVFCLVNACVERIEFNVPMAEFQTVVEGMITDSPGPYTIKVSKGLSLDADALSHAPYQHVKIRLMDDEGNTESLSEASPGVYVTGGIIQGKVGHSYHIVLETPEGNIFESQPDKINPVGELENIRFEFEARTVVRNFGEVEANVFKIYVDAQAGSGDDNFVRWRFKGTYKVVTNPEEHMVYNPPYTPYKDPRQCSGWILDVGPVGSGGILVQVDDCTCCTCWVNHFEDAPQLSDTELITNNEFKNLKIGEVPVNNNTFSDKYMVEVGQMSLSRSSFEFFKLIRSQKEGASSLFQPPSGELKGNVQGVNNSHAVIGLFWATSVRQKTTFIHRSDVPYPLTPIEYIAEDCRLRYENSSNIKPANWE